MSKAERVKRKVLAVEIPRDELALRIAAQCTNMVPPIGVNATDALNEMNMTVGNLPMGETFRRAADEAVKYLHECINNGSSTQ